MAKKIDQRGHVYFVSPYDHGQSHLPTPSAIVHSPSLRTAVQSEISRKNGSSLEQVYEDLESIFMAKYPQMSSEEIYAYINKRMGRKSFF